MTHGSACWSDILNNLPPRTSTSSRCPSRAIKYPYTSIPKVEMSELKAQLEFKCSRYCSSGAHVYCNYKSRDKDSTFNEVRVQHLGLFKLEDRVLSVTRPEVDVGKTHQEVHVIS